ncbi:hypothetical protein R3P38DRAFT_2573208 [Favolaschia claudopus]|uniref:Uncharacterized protein n=1 Tax=Favolaschia claudopus TaxID=2862362 RepID=A0AAV9ZPR3_9AGAR
MVWVSCLKHQHTICWRTTGTERTHHHTFIIPNKHTSFWTQVFKFSRLEQLKSRTLSTKHGCSLPPHTYKQGNSSISFRHPATGSKDFGYIEAIWSQRLQGQLRTFVVVAPHTAVTETDAAKTPYASHPRFACFVCYSAPRFHRPQLVIEPSYIISHVAYRRRPKGTFGIEQAVTIFVDSLHRGRD